MEKQEQTLKEKFSALKSEVPNLKATTFEQVKEYFNKPENGIEYLLDIMAWYIEVQKMFDGTRQLLDGAKQLLKEAMELKKEIDRKLTEESQGKVIEQKTIH